jgi:hypothetical protein
MEQFGIIEGLKALATAKGWTFRLKFDEFYSNIENQKEYANGEHVFTVDARTRPIVRDGRIVELQYTCLCALGRKFDTDGKAATLDETFTQKYDRRLSDLQSSLANGLAGFACANELALVFSDFLFDINVYDTNIDFVTTTATFTQ